MAFQDEQYVGTNGDQRSKDIGIFIKGGGIILRGEVYLLDIELDEYFKMLQVGGGGDIIWQTASGALNCALGVNNGSWIPAHGRKVLSQGVIQGETIITTCTDITWHGGE